MINELRSWSDFLDVQIAHFEQEIVRQTGQSYVATEINVAFLRTDEDLVRDALNSAVREFIRVGKWPGLDARQCRHLILRAFCARGAILAVLEGGPAGATIGPQLAKLKGRNETIRWLFIDSWHAGGTAFIDAMADEFLKDQASRK